MKTEIEKKQEGNMAALREALLSCLDTICRIVWIDDPVYDENGHYLGANYAAVSRDKVRDALATPARNCDRYATPDEAELAFDDYCHARRENPTEVCRRKSCRDCQREWLYAVANEGESDEQK